MLAYSSSKMHSIISVRPYNHSSSLNGKAVFENSINAQEKDEQKSSKKPKSDRGHWNNQFEQILATLGPAVGLGNIWRFPYLVYKNGGGTFLIPYLVMYIFTVMPTFFLQLVLGQYSGKAQAMVFEQISPVLKGLGFAMLLAGFFGNIYFFVMVGWIIFYIVSGFTSELPWTKCTEESSSRCVYNQTMSKFDVGPAEDFFLHQMLGLDKDIHSWNNFGSIRWEIAACLLAAWSITCLSTIKGAESMGKVLYFTKIFPFLVLIALFIFGTTLDGAGDGFYYFLKPDVTKLGSIGVWKDAALEGFFSLSLTGGAMISLASYNSFDNDCHRDAWLIAVVSCGTSFFSGLVVFSILGFMAKETGSNIEDVVQSGSALAFVVYPQAVVRMPLPPLWSFLFFFMLLTLGLGSMFGCVEMISTAVIDHFSLTKKRPYVVISACIIMFLCGLPMCCNGGYYLFNLLDNVAFSWNAMICALMEVMIMAFLYGVNNVCEDIRDMGIRMPIVLEYYWKACWCFITPAVLLFLLIMSFVDQKPLRLDDYVYPDSIQVLGWSIPSVCVFLIPLFGIQHIISIYRNDVEKFQDYKLTLKKLFKPSSNWGPQMVFKEVYAIYTKTIKKPILIRYAMDQD